MEIKLNNEETSVLRVLLSQLTIKSRTGELGIIHGMDRFVSTNQVFKKKELEHLDQLAQKIGLNNDFGKI